MRERVTLLIVQDEQLLLIERKKHGRCYYVIPGGGVEAGETPQQAALREAVEETSLTVTLGVQLWQRPVRGDQRETAFLVDRFEGEPKLSDPEFLGQSENNRYRLVWLPLSRAAALPNLYPGPVDVAALARARGGEDR